jgi:hypothetical protein
VINYGRSGCLQISGISTESRPYTYATSFGIMNWIVTEIGLRGELPHLLQVGELSSSSRMDTNDEVLEDQTDESACCAGKAKSEKLRRNIQCRKLNSAKSRTNFLHFIDLIASRAEIQGSPMTEPTFEVVVPPYRTLHHLSSHVPQSQT